MLGEVGQVPAVQGKEWPAVAKVMLMSFVITWRANREPASVGWDAELPGEPPDVAAEGEVAEAGGGVDQEVGDDQGGGAGAALVDAAEEEAEG